MRVALVGTSNSVKRRGLQWIFESAEDVEFTNLSLGSSCSAVAAFATKELDFKNFDFVLLDLTNNDEHQTANGLNSAERVLNCILTIVDRCSRSNTVPVILSFPRLAFIHADKPVHVEVMETARKLGIMSLDIYYVIERAAALIGQSKSMDFFFSDAAHIKDPVARMLGLELLEILRRATTHGSVSRVDRPMQYFEIDYVSASNIDGAETIRRKTSLATQDHSILRKGLEYHFDFGAQDGNVVALHFNALETSAALFIGKARAMGRSPETDSKSTSALLSVIRPVAVPIPVNGVSQLRVIDEAARENPVRVELSGFVTERRLEKRSSVCVASTPLQGLQIAHVLPDHLLRHIGVSAV